jgi:ribosomal small subunit protein bTHX
MGKGDQRSKRGKIHVGTHGVTRLRKKKAVKKAGGVSTSAKKKAPKKAAKKAAK